MRFYTKQHQFYCGVDLHADAMYVCILNSVGDIVVHKNIPSKKPRPKDGALKAPPEGALPAAPKEGSRSVVPLSCWVKI